MSQHDDDFVKKVANELKINSKVLRKLFKSYIIHLLLKYGEEIEKGKEGLNDFEFFFPYFGRINVHWEKDVRDVKSKQIKAQCTFDVELQDRILEFISDLHDGYLNNLIEVAVKDEIFN